MKKRQRRHGEPKKKQKEQNSDQRLKNQRQNGHERKTNKRRQPGGRQEKMWGEWRHLEGKQEHT